jgi:HlyD family secretion protein
LSASPASRNISMALAAALVAAGIIYGFMPNPILVDLALVQSGPLQVTVEEEGETRVVHRYQVSSPLAGSASRIALKVGDRLLAGALVAQITPIASQLLDARSQAEAEAALGMATAALGSARQQLEAARSAADLADADRERIAGLYQQGDASQALMDRAKADHHSGNALLRAAEFAVTVARHEEAAAAAVLHAGETSGNGQRIPVTSPIDGHVLKVFRESEGVVATAEPLIEVGDTSSLEVQVDVLSADAVKITPGMRVLFHRWGGPAPLEGQVRRIEPVGFTKVSALGVEEQRVLVISDIVSDPQDWQRLGDGYRVEAEFVLWETSATLQVPGSSLFRHDDGWAVFVADDSRAHLRKVTTGRRSGLSTQITDGLVNGESVIIHPGVALGDGHRIVIH